MFSQASVILSTGEGACMAGGCAWQGACMARACMWPGGMHGQGDVCSWGVCWGAGDMCARGHVWQGGHVAGEHV